MQKYDIIGDIHGYATPLNALLVKLGYQEQAGVFRHPERKVIFLGDFIDRGPEIRETLRLVRAMVDGGSALAVMGNHEFNALAYHNPDGHGSFLRQHTEEKMRQHHETLQQLALPHPDEWAGYLDWFATLPLLLDLGGLRVVHASWDRQAVETVSSLKRIDGPTLRAMALGGGPLNRYKQNLLNGLEIDLPEGYTNPDKEGVKRDCIRARWWEPLAGKTYREAVFPDSEVVPGVHIPSALLAQDLAYGPDEPPVFFGHYWLPSDTARAPLATNVACLDFSVAKGGDLTAYRWDGEQKLLPEKFVIVGKIPLTSGYRVFVDDNFHFMDEDERWCLGEFATYDEALQAARRLVEGFFDEKSLGQPADKLYEGYTMFGDDPWIVPFGNALVPPIHFSAWDYAKEVSQFLSAR